MMEPITLMIRVIGLVRGLIWQSISSDHCYIQWVDVASGIITEFLGYEVQSLVLVFCLVVGGSGTLKSLYSITRQV